MSGLTRRIRRRRATASEQSPAPLPQAADARPATLAPAPDAGEALPDGLRDLPAGLDPEEIGREVESQRRGSLRRRLRYLTHARHLLLRDLGGLVYEIHRSSDEPRLHEGLVAAKVARLAGLDAEARGLRERLAAPAAPVVLREPGIGGTCPGCGELYSSEANYCFACGTPVSERAQREVAEREAEWLAAHEAAEAARAREAEAEEAARAQEAEAEDELARARDPGAESAARARDVEEDDEPGDAVPAPPPADGRHGDAESRSEDPTVVERRDDRADPLAETAWLRRP